MQYYPVCKFTEVGFGEGKAVEVEGRQIALFNAGGKLYAIDNRCPHMSAPLHDGSLEGKTIVCRLHFWEFDITTGQSTNQPGQCVKTYPVKIERGVVKVAIEADTQL
ncbi:MAG: Rieske (2Fe-2S) protein [Blastocatellia bacterium]|nr:Rieske (2Fe-2S) protein [Blastocatellia bacterium]